MAKATVAHPKQFPCFIGFWTTEAQRQRLAALAAHTGLNRGHVIRTLIDRARLQVVVVELEDPSPPGTPEHAA
jgi:hypothetical protein